MDPIYKPLTNEQKQDLEKRGYKEFEYMSMANWNDPDSLTYHMSSAFVFGVSLYGRYFCRKNQQPCGLFSINICLIPIFYFASFKIKHVDQIFSPYRARPTFSECLEFYPVTRRAFKRALILREKEMQEIKSKINDKSVLAE